MNRIQSNPTADIIISEVTLVLEGTVSPGFFPKKKFGRPHHGLVYVLSGYARYGFDDNPVDLRPGSIMMMTKGSCYTVTIDSDNYRYIYVDFDVISPGTLPLRNTVYTPRNADAIEHLFHKLERCWFYKHPSHPLKAKALLYEVLSLIIDSQAAAYLPSAQYKQIEPAVRYMENHFTDPGLTISELEARTEISPVHFRRLFKEIYLMPPRKYLILLRIRRAKDLLRHQSYTITQVAEMTGFASVYYFSQTFKQETGKTPSDFILSYDSN